MSTTTNSRVCPKCNVEKLRDEFHVESARRDKMSYRCKVCQSLWDKERHARDRVKRLEQQKAWYRLNAKERSQKARQWAINNPERKKLTKRKNDLAAYGLTPESFEAMSKAQGEMCAICKGPPAGKYSVLVVDHSHDTGEVRGLLCSPCNMGIGMLKDDVAVLQSAVRYLAQKGRDHDQYETQ